ncbi:hypothetical protein [Brazilian marseillevirus]|uniref:hypothetical protein n=1 Tax=Brazilian marseillevirus TaxID=1813599 RepID=UPI000782E58F|nr:hypothetical protein A3303_gp200 [Brazilian marseillevirus]AMQ10708.1 hypothetical protein [Brazilian marseillevirus]
MQSEENIYLVSSLKKEISDLQSRIIQRKKHIERLSGGEKSSVTLFLIVKSQEKISQYEKEINEKRRRILSLE